LPGDEAVRPHIEAALRRIAALLTAAVLCGQKSGAFKTSLDGRAVGNFLLCIVQGLRVLGKTDLAGPELVAIVDIAMRAFE
jgi:TetR/AcrR family transcriptional regulator, transcriptional repressor for nem operon